MDDFEYMDEDLFRQNQLNNNLNKILSAISLFLSNVERFKLEDYQLKKLIYKHPIYKNKNKINEFANKINDSEIISSKVIELQEESEMRKKRRSEIADLKKFLNNKQFKNLLTGENINKEKLPSPEEPKDKNDENNENKNNEKNKEDDILVEDTKDVEKRDFLLKKRKKDKKKEKFIYKNCYICKQILGLDNTSKFYGSICTKCGDYNYSFRTMKLDFSGRIALVTGGRVKIGFYIVKKLLSYGCKVITTSRFPIDTLDKYKEDPDYEIWKDNLIIYPIDFRWFESTVKFVDYITKNFPHLDFLINNAAQTVRRTAAYYDDSLMAIETKKLNADDDKKIIKNDYLSIRKQLSEEKDIDKKKNKEEMSNALVSLAKKDKKEFDEILPLSVIASTIRIMDEKEQPNIYIMGPDGQPYDFSKGKNSWNFEIDEIPFQEFTEVQIINAWTPYYLCAKLKTLMEKSPFMDKYIVNVTAVEGIFYHFKRTTHVHTNMAKAALNMLTRTCAKYLEKENIYMTCVDTGWVSHMNEMNKMIDPDTKENSENEMAIIPLDELDGAMRVLHPIIEGIKNKKYYFGVLLKDYMVSKW